MPERRIPFPDLAGADLVVDAVYEAGAAGNWSDDPISKLLPVGHSGGFRFKGSATAPLIVAMCSSGKDPDWPDGLDPETGIYTYYGDNRTPGHDIHATGRGGNVILRHVFELLHSGRHSEVPPFFVFEATGEGRNNRFLGLAVPGAHQVQPTDDLVAVWRTKEGSRFQNYRAMFTVLNAAQVPRTWIESVLDGNPLTEDCPSALLRFWRDRRYVPLEAPRSRTHRTRAEQLPTEEDELAVVGAVHRYFSDEPHRFEACAAELWRMQHGPSVVRLETTRPTADGGRDAVGAIGVGPTSDPILLDFALEAKCYEPGKAGSGVKDVARLISRLRHRQFGVFVTTSYVGEQAYKEIRDDAHPVVVIAGRDVVGILRKHGVSTAAEAMTWLKTNFPPPTD